MAHAHDPFPSCDVCGRTILKGEQIHEYLTPQRQRIRVCVLCRSRAESAGWIPVSMEHTIAEEEPKRSRGLGLRKRLKGAAARARSNRGRRGGASQEDEIGGPEQEWDDLDAAMGQPDQGAWPPPADDAPERIAGARAAEPAAEDQAPRGPEAEPADTRAQEPAERPRVRKPAKPRAKGAPRSRSTKSEDRPRTARPKTTRKAKRGPEALMRRAVERFNSCEERRKVAGLIRSLGEPNAGVRPDQRRQMAVVTVAWELSWYQWEVGAEGDGDDDQPVREIAKGDEVSQLDDEARAWNAVVAEDGTLRLRAASARRRQEAASEA